ncbi:MAG TPA: choice-of-anchor Q domain-containing protein [Patescibacteria group bacterium]|nr:choice-of-anchor Q domain-containing protein [Patescibacteria group bacterium]
MFASSQAQAFAILVDSAADNLTAGDAACTLREAIDNANWDADLTSGDCEPGLAGMDTIEIQAGLPTIVLNGNELQIRKTMAIIGPASGQEISGNDLSRVLHLRMDLDPAGTHDYRLENLRIVDGQTTAPSFGSPTDCAGRSGGLCMASGSINVQHRARLRNVEFHDNRSYGDFSVGGGAYFGAGVIDVEITGALFDGNEAGGVGNVGGGAYFDGVERVRLANARFIGNVATGVAGALVVTGAQSFSLSSANVSNNQARHDQPSAVVIDDTQQVFVHDSVFQTNLNLDDFLNLTHEGYAIRVSGSGADVASFSNLWIDQNLGCGLGVVGVSAFVSNSTFSRNQCDHEGAAFGVHGATVEVTASSILDNINALPAVQVDGGSLKLESSTVVANQATTPGEAGGIRLDAGTLILRNTILADNAGSAGSFQRVGGTVNAAYSQFGDASAEINGSSSNNLFMGTTNLGAFGDHGCAAKAGDSIVGPPVCVQMRPLSSSSAAREQGSAYGAAYDQRGPGFVRVEGAAADIGAYEYQAPQISIEAVAANQAEGHGGQTVFQFRVRRNGDLRDPSWAAWHVAGDGTNPADASDFDPGSWIGGSAYFAAGANEVLVNLYVIGDATPEQNEGFRVALGALTNGTMGSPSAATGEIINDDGLFPAATLSLSRLAVDVNEGQWLYSTHRFRVTRAQVTTGFCSVDVRLSGTGSFAATDDDFFGISTGVLNRYQMAPGETHFDVEVRVAGDGQLEFDETFELRLENPSGCFIASSAATATSTIVNDDSAIWIEAVTAATLEGNSGSTAYSFLVQRGLSDVNPASVQYAVSGSGADPAEANDFTGGAYPAGALNFATGQSEIVLVINVAGDAVTESDEGFRVTLSNPGGGGITPVGQVDATIQNDDGLGDLLFHNSFE